MQKHANAACFSVSIRRPERGRIKPLRAGQLQPFCSRHRCWNTLISLITLHSPAVDGYISSVFSIMESILTQFREKAVQTNLPHTYMFNPLSMSHPPRVVATIYCLYIIDLLDVRQPSLRGGREQEWINHRESATNTRMTSLYVRCLTRDGTEPQFDWMASLTDREESDKRGYEWLRKGEFFSSYTVRSRSRRWETHSLWLKMSKTLWE